MRDGATNERRIHPWEKDSGEGVSFGSWLRQQREIRGVSLREIADVSKISIRYLEALEASRFSVLPAPVFAKGFLRQYASFVGLDPDEAVNYYIVAQQETAPEEEIIPASAKLRSSAHWAYGLFLTAFLVALFGVVWFLSFFAERQASQRQERPPMAVPVFSPPPAQPLRVESSRAPLVVTLEFIQDCWVEASVDGEHRVSELRVQGESLQLDAEEIVTLTLGNWKGVRIEANGSDFAIPPSRGNVVNDLTIRLDSLSALNGEDDD